MTIPHSTAEHAAYCFTTVMVCVLCILCAGIWGGDIDITPLREAIRDTLEML